MFQLVILCHTNKFYTAVSRVSVCLSSSSHSHYVIASSRHSASWGAKNSAEKNRTVLYYCYFPRAVFHAALQLDERLVEANYCRTPQLLFCIFLKLYTACISVSLKSDPLLDFSACFNILLCLMLIYPTGF